MCPNGRILIATLLSLALGSAPACGGDEGGDGGGDGASWELVHRDLPAALLSVWGTSSTDIWTAGGDAGDGPVVLHYDGTEWQDLDTGTVGDLWWVFGFSGGPVYLGGAGGRILSYQDGAFTAMPTPADDVTVFGIWGCSPGDVWAVGGKEGGQNGGFAWRLDGAGWVEAQGFPAAEVSATDAVWKVFGRGCDDVWMVGTSGLALRWDGASFGPVERVADSSLFTVHASAERFAAAGGLGEAILENDGSGWVDVSPRGVQTAFGVCLTEQGGFASGPYGSVLAREGDTWVPEQTGLQLDESFHSVWVDPDGGVWVAGGQVLVPPLSDGVMLHRRP